MKSKIFVIVMAVVLMFVAGQVFAGDFSNENQMESSQGQDQQLIYAPKSEGNTSIGSWPGVGGMLPGLMDLPLSYQLLMNQYNESTSKEIFSSLPEEITSEMVQVYEETVLEELGKRQYKKMQKEIGRRSIILRRFESTSSIRPFPMLPREVIAKKGKDYQIIGRLVFRSKDDIDDLLREDLALLICKAAMTRGANAFVPTGEGAERIFAAKSGGLSFLTAFAKIFASTNPYGLNVSPGGGFSSGSNGVNAMPYLRVTLIRYVDKKKTELAMMPAPAETPKTKTVVVEKQELNKQGTDLLNCPNPVEANGIKRLHSANAELEKYFSVKQSYERDLALVRTRDDLAQAVRDGLTGERLKTAQLGLASVWWEMSQQTTADKKVYIRKAIGWANQAGEEQFPDVVAFKARLENTLAGVQ